MRDPSYISHMATRTANLASAKSDTYKADNAVLTVRPDTRMVKLGSLIPLLVVIVGVAAYLTPFTIYPDYKVAGLIIISTLAMAGITGLVLAYEALGHAVYTVTKDHVEEEYGIIYKKVRRIPLSYVRDVTYDQNFLQAMLGVSTVTVSPTNGNRIVLSNIKNGEAARETIWKLVLLRSPEEQRRS